MHRTILQVLVIWDGDGDMAVSTRAFQFKASCVKLGSISNDGIKKDANSFANRTLSFYFYSYDCNEPRHMHIDRERMSAKYWLDPDVSLAENYGFNRKELRDIERIARQNLERLRHEWDAFCGGSANSSESN